MASGVVVLRSGLLRVQGGRTSIAIGGRQSPPRRNKGRLGADTITLGLAASEFFRDGGYDYAGEGRKRSIEEHLGYLGGLVERYPIASIEDPMAEEDFEGWKRLHSCTSVSVLRRPSTYVSLSGAACRSRRLSICWSGCYSG